MDRMLSRRTLLAGSASLTLGAVVGCSARGPVTRRLGEPNRGTDLHRTFAEQVTDRFPERELDQRDTEAECQSDRRSQAQGGRHDRRRPERAVEHRLPRLRRRARLGAGHRPHPQDHARRARCPRSAKCRACRPPSGLGEGGLLGLALDPGDRGDAVRVLHDQLGQPGGAAQPGRRQGRQAARGAHRDPDQHPPSRRSAAVRPRRQPVRVHRRRRGVLPGAEPELAGGQDPADQAERQGRLGQPVREPDLDVRPPQHRRTGVRRRRPAVGHRVR